MHHPTARSLASAACALLLAGCVVTPEPITLAEASLQSGSLLDRAKQQVEPVSGPIDLYEAMARALKYNLDHHVELMDNALRVRELDLAHYNLLPNVVASSGFAARDSYLASSSYNILTNTQNFGASTSSDKRISTSDVAFSWNILDFGLSWVRAHQSADKVLISEENRRKIIQRVIEDVRTAYWRAVSGDRLLVKLRQLEGRARQAQASSRSISAERSTSPVTALTYERELVDIRRTIHDLERDLIVAKSQLAALMNLPPDMKFALVTPRRNGKLTLDLSAHDVVETALNNRSELRDVWYKKRINAREYDAAFLELLPGINVIAGSNFDSNEFLYNNNWVNWGAKAAWNVMRIAQYPAKRAVIEAQDELFDARARALAVAIMTQVHISRIRFYHFSKELSTANEFLDVQTRLMTAMRIEAGADRISEHMLIREEMNTLIAEVKRDIVHAHLQNAYANVFGSMGLDVGTSGLRLDEDLRAVAQAMRNAWHEHGDVNASRRRSLASTR